MTESGLIYPASKERVPTERCLFWDFDGAAGDARADDSGRWWRFMRSPVRKRSGLDDERPLLSWRTLAIDIGVTKAARDKRRLLRTVLVQKRLAVALKGAIAGRSSAGENVETVIK